MLSQEVQLSSPKMWIEKESSAALTNLVHLSTYSYRSLLSGRVNLLTRHVNACVITCTVPPSIEWTSIYKHRYQILTALSTVASFHKSLECQTRLECHHFFFPSFHGRLIHVQDRSGLSIFRGQHEWAEIKKLSVVRLFVDLHQKLWNTRIIVNPNIPLPVCVCSPFLFSSEDNDKHEHAKCTIALWCYLVWPRDRIPKGPQKISYRTVTGKMVYNWNWASYCVC